MRYAILPNIWCCQIDQWASRAKMRGVSRYLQSLTSEPRSLDNGIFLPAEDMLTIKSYKEESSQKCILFSKQYEVVVAGEN